MKASELSQGDVVKVKAKYGKRDAIVIETGYSKQNGWSNRYRKVAQGGMFVAVATKRTVSGVDFWQPDYVATFHILGMKDEVDAATEIRNAEIRKADAERAVWAKQNAERNEAIRDQLHELGLGLVEPTKQQTAVVLTNAQVEALLAKLAKADA